jgi:hypothetical protein
MLVLVPAAVIEASGKVVNQRFRQPPDPFMAIAWQLCRRRRRLAHRGCGRRGTVLPRQVWDLPAGDVFENPA